MGDVEAPIKIAMRVFVQVEVNGASVEGWLPAQWFHAQRADRLVDVGECAAFVRSAVIRAVSPERSTEDLAKKISDACRRPLGVVRKTPLAR